LDLIFTLEEPFASEHFPQTYTQRELITSAINVAAHGLLRWHIMKLPLQHTRLRSGTLIARFCNSEIYYFCDSVYTHHNIVGTNVSVNNIETLTRYGFRMMSVVQTHGRF
jgi:hypothetical protein